jgi:thiamine-monophosphate kinase
MALRRDGGKPGDLLVVSGTLGDAAAGLEYVQSRASLEEGSAAMKLVRRFEYPTPRVALGLAARAIASGAMDISDGLAADVPKFARASGVRAGIEAGKVPTSRELQALCNSEHALDLALGGGDDYELLFSVPPQKFEPLAREARRLNLTLTIIGELREGAGVQWTMNGDDFAPRVKGFDHFDRPSTQITV